MVQYPHPDLEAAAAKARHADIRREAERWRLARREKQGPPSWLPPQGCWLLCQLGKALVWLGQRLEDCGPTADASGAEPAGRSSWAASR